MVVRKNVLEYIIALVAVKNKVRLKNCLTRNISEFYVNLRFEVGKHPQVILAMNLFLSWTRIMSVLIG
jgi:hypothetical protein